MQRKLLAAALLTVGVAALCYAAQGQGQRPIGIVAAMIAFFAAATLISRVGFLAAELRPFIGKTMAVRAWGDELPEGQTFEVVSVRAIGAGLHLYLKPAVGSPLHLKIAQPRRVQVTDSTIQIADAKYVQWAGHKLECPRDGSGPALTMVLKN